MVTETSNGVAVGEDAPITEDEIAAVRERLLRENPALAEELQNKNTEMISFTVPLGLKLLADDAAKNADGSPGSTAEFVRDLLAEKFNYTLPVRQPKAKPAKRDKDLEKAAQRSIMNDLIARSRAAGVGVA